MIDQERYQNIATILYRAMRTVLEANIELQQILEEEGIILDLPSFPDISEFEDPLYHED